MWVRTKIRIGWLDLALGALKARFQPDRAQELAKVESFFSNDGTWMASYSVRTGFELLLKALKLEPGDEVIFSAVNVAGMVKIVNELGLVPVPVDLRYGDLSPVPALLEKAITPRSKVFIAAHLFGTRAELDEVFSIAKAHGLVTVEDCAQAFNGRDYPGNPLADVVMFSFGPIKTATALGGALLQVKDKAVLVDMRAMQAKYRMQTGKQQMKRVRSAAGLKIMSNQVVLERIFQFYKKRNRNYEEELSNKVRDVAPLKQANGLQFQPAAGLLWLMNRRMRQLTPAALAKRAGKGAKLQGLLKDVVVFPGHAAKHHDYWLFGGLADNPKVLTEALRNSGFDAGGLPRSQVVMPPPGRQDLGPVLAKRLLDHIIVVPCYESLPDREIEREAGVIRAALATAGTTEMMKLKTTMDERPAK